VVAEGDVEIIYQDVKLKGDKVSFYTHTKDLIAEGNVALYQGKNYLKCDRLEFNLISKTGVAYRAKGLFSPYYYVEGEKIEKVSDKRYIVEKGKLTTCSPKVKGCKRTPDWHFKAKKLTIDVGGYARGGPVTFWIKKIPILYTPYLKVPVYKERKTGFLIPVPGYDSHKGFFVSVPFFWAISDNQDATITVTPYSKKGLRGSLEYRYIIDEHSKGYFWGDYTKRKDPDREKWSILFKHHQLFPHDWRLLARVDIRSDERYAKNYLDEFERRVERYTDSYVTLTKNWWDTHFSIEFRGKKDLENDFGETTYKFPEIEFSILDKPVFGQIYFEAEDSFLRYEKKLNTSNVDLSHQVARLDLHPVVSLLVSPASWISVTPRVGIRETWYSKTLEDDENVRDNSNNRLLPDLGFKIRGPLIAKIFRIDNNRLLKHMIVPEIEYTYIPRKYQDDIPVFDPIDRILPQDTFTFSLTNWLYLYTEKSAKKLAKVKLEQSYYAHFHLESSPTHRPFSDLLLDVDTDILPGINLDTQLAYNVYGEGVTTWDVQGSISQSIFRVSGSYHYKKSPEERFLILQPGVKLGSFDIFTAWRYDLKDHFPREREWRVIYQSECWSLTFSYLNIDNRGTDAANERKYSFLITLKGIGTIGKKR